MQATNEAVSVDINANDALRFSHVLDARKEEKTVPGDSAKPLSGRLLFWTGCLLVAVGLVGIKLYMSQPSSVDIETLHRRIAIVD